MEHGNYTTGYPVIASTEEPPFRFDDPIQRTILAVCISIISVLGLPGNALVVFSVFASRKLQTSTNAFVVNLAISDFISCGFVIFHSVAFFGDGQILSDSVGLCKIIGAITYITFGASIMNLALIAVNRFVLITLPRWTYDKLYGIAGVSLMILFAWVYVILVAILPPALDFGELGFSPRYSVCTVNSEHPTAFYNEMLRSLLLQIPCLVVIIGCYFLIYRFLKKNGIFRMIKRDRSQSNVVEEQKNISRQARQVKVTKNLFIVVCAYILCIMPFAVACLIPRSYVVIPWTSLLVICNSCVNPFIYGFNHPQFRSTFALILSCKCGQIPEPSNFIHAMTSKTDT